MPHLQNCDHCDDGWCLDCVKELHDLLMQVENDSIDNGAEESLLREAIKSARLA